jgi:hypothetical protein
LVLYIEEEIISSSVYSMEMINVNLENESIDEEVDVFNTVLPR